MNVSSSLPKRCVPPRSRAPTVSSRRALLRRPIRRTRRSWRGRSRISPDKLARADSTGDVESQKLSEQMARAEELREKIDELGRELEKLGQQGQPASASAAGQQPSADASGRGGQGIDSATLERMRQEYTEQLKDTRELLNELGRDNTYTQEVPA